jgi:hypothetical protein
MKNSILHIHRTAVYIIVSAISLSGLMVIASPAAAGPCRSGDAASRGSQTGYERDRKGADQTEQQDRSASDTLGRCVSGITSVTTIQQFPSLSEIYEQIKTQVCKVASEQVHNASSDATSRINSAMRDVSTPQNAQALATSTSTASTGSDTVAPAATPTPNSASAAEMLKNIWR